MIAPQVLLPFVLAALGLYILDGTGRIRALRAENTPEKRTQFFRHKITRQIAAMALVPALALWASNTLQSALTPGDRIAGLASAVTALTGVSGRDVTGFWSVKTALEILLLVLVVEVLPLLTKSMPPLALGDIHILLPRTMPEVGYCSIMAVVAGVGEELLFRGFIPTALSNYGASAECSFIAPIAIFAICHLYQGFVGVLATGAAGVMLTMVYLLTGSLVQAMTLHAAIDLIGLVLRPLAGMALRRIALQVGHTPLG